MNAPPSAARPGAAVAFGAGLAIAAGALLILGIMAATADEIAPPRSTLARHDGNVTLAYAVFQHVRVQSVVDLEWSLPVDGGRVVLLRCDSFEDLREGRAPSVPPIALSTEKAGVLAITTGELLHIDAMAASGELPFCGPPVVALQWPDTGETMPTVQMTLRERPLDEGPAFALMLVAAVGAAIAAFGGIHWTRRAPPLSPADDLESTAETLLRLSDRTIALLERVRRYVVIAGAIGIVPLYPILLLWAWHTGRGQSEDAFVVLALVLAVVAVLGALTAVWAREYLRLSHEINGWRDRMERLRAREAELMRLLTEA